MNRILRIVGGAANLLFAAFHLTFPWLFRWNTELNILSSVNRATIYTLHTAVVLVLVLFAYVSIVHWHDLLTTGLGRAVTLAICLPTGHTRAGQRRRSWRLSRLSSSGIRC